MTIKKTIEKWRDGDSGSFSDGTEFRLARVRAPEKRQADGSKATKVASRMTGRSKSK